MSDVDLNAYKDFVKAVTSQESNNTEAFITRIKTFDGSGVNMPLLLTASIGLSSEGGEFSEIVKKIVFQGKQLNEENRFHMKRELGDIAWYWVNACRALGYDPNDVIAENVSKLQARYPGGEFDVYRSENRKAGDL
jgi:NTP pyrophosphatase (non-canonical NTP hydrolase)